MIEHLTPTYRKQLEQRVWSKIERAAPNRCWLWGASTDRSGYGKISVHGRMIIATRVVYELATGQSLTRDQVICHRCDNPACCNPAHLFVGSQSDNMDDMHRKQRHSQNQKGERNGNARLSAEQVREIRRRYIPHKVGVKKLGKEYGVHYDTIHKIVTRKSWRHLS
ncbi:MAG: HNH endonuclease [Anaerolineae bacterium]|nr:HNH endonuclease [Anaerolineae bacterium]